MRPEVDASFIRHESENPSDPDLREPPMKLEYRAVTKQGEPLSGILDLDSQEKAMEHLERMGYSVLEIKEHSAMLGRVEDLMESFQKLDKQEVILFTRQMATLIRSGMPLLPSLSTIVDQCTNRKFKIVLENIRDEVQNGESFSAALSKYPKIFSELFVCMIQVGETGGVLDQVLDRLASLSTQEMEIYSRIRSALTYPIVLLVLAILMVNFIMVSVIPKFAMVFKASDAALPLPTQIVLTMSWFFKKFWWAVVIGCVGGYISFKRYISSEQGRYKFHKLLMKLPVMGPLYTKVQISRLARSLSTLTAVGVPILQGFGVVEKVVSNEVIRKTIRDIRDAITGGSSLVDPFRASGVFSPMVVQMIAIGEKTGKIDEMLSEVSNFYDPEIEYAIKNLTSLLEPFMLLGMGLMVAFIALSVLLPIFNLIKVFRG